MMILKTPRGKLLIDFRQKAVKGYCKGIAGFKAQIKGLKEVMADGRKSNL